jgi:hypothetical protein
VKSERSEFHRAVLRHRPKAQAKAGHSRSEWSGVFGKFAILASPSQSYVFHRLPNSIIRRTHEWYQITIIAPVNSKIGTINGQYLVGRINFAQPNHAQIRQVGLLVIKLLSQPKQIRPLILRTHGDPHQTTCHHEQSRSARFQVKRGFRENCFTGEQWRLQTIQQINRPIVILITLVCNGYEKPCIRDGFQIVL